MPVARSVKTSDRFWFSPGAVSSRLLVYLGVNFNSSPKDKWYIVYIILIIQGLGTFTAFNMLITAKDYFVEYKLKDTIYAGNFLAKLGVAMEIPNVLFSWLNVFVNMGGNLANRVVWSLLSEIAIFLITDILAMMDTSAWPDAFFWITMVSAFVVNGSNAIYLNSTFGLSSVLPPKYSGALVLGCNVCGVVVVLVNWASDVAGGSLKTSGVYYFFAGMVVFVVCLQTFLALPLTRFYRHHAKQARSLKDDREVNPPYWTIFKQSWVQCYTVFITDCVSLSVFPAIHSDIHSFSGLFGKDFARITCFVTYNFTALIGSITASILYFPTRRWLWIMATARLAFIPFFLLCNYRPQHKGVLLKRTMPVLIRDDFVYWVGAMLMGWSMGHVSTLGMMYVSGGDVEEKYASTAGMIGAAMLISGVMTGITFSLIAPSLVCSSIWSG